jgi:hypothetical protein
MRIVFRKVSHERHSLAIVRDDGQREEVECETRSMLVHDLLHLAVENEAKLNAGFWGNLAKGKTLADMNDRTGVAMAAEAPELMVIERLVGALSGAVKGRSAAEMVAALESYANALGTALPEWLTEELVLAVQVHMRHLMGRWKATPFGGEMEIEWLSL